MLEKFLKQTKFSSQEDFIKNFRINVPENFNFGYDVVDEWARIAPEKKALCWTNEQDHHIDFTFADIKRESDKTAAFFLSLGIKRGDMVMLILKRRYEFWFSIIALHKIGAVCIPATHLLTEKDIIYRCNAADIKMIVAVGEEPVIGHIDRSIADSPTLKYRVSVGPEVPEGWLDFHAGIEAAAPFERPALANTNDDTSLLYFTSGTTGDPKMVAHDFTYPLGHIVTGSYWHNLNEESLHLTLADTGWGKAVWGKLYGQWIAGANVFVYDFDKFVPAHVLDMIEKYHITSFCAPPYGIPVPDTRRYIELRHLVVALLYDSRRSPEPESIRRVLPHHGNQTDGRIRTNRNHPHHSHLSMDRAQTGNRRAYPTRNTTSICLLPTADRPKTVNRDKSLSVPIRENRQVFSKNIIAMKQKLAKPITTISTIRAMLLGAMKTVTTGLSAVPTT